MRRNRAILSLLLVLPFLLYMASAEESHGAPLTDFLGKLVNFLVLFAGLAILLRKPLGNFLKERADSLSHSMEDAKKSHEEAAQKLNEVESRLKNLDAEVDQLMQKAESDGQALHQNIIEEARKDAERLKRLARTEIEILTQEAIRDIKQYTVAVAADLAQQKIRQQMTEETQSSFIDKSIERIETLHEKSNPDKTVRTGTH